MNGYETIVESYSDNMPDAKAVLDRVEVIKESQIHMILRL